MKNIVIAAALFSTSAFAAPFVEYDYDYKDKLVDGSKANHEVNGFVFGNKVTDKLTIGAKAEVENVSNTDTLEGLIQGQVKYNLFTWQTLVPVTPYVNLAIGEKFKVGNDFEFGVAGVGVNFKLTDKLGVDVAGRYRNGFDAVDHYETKEASVKAAYAITENHVLGVRGAFERGDSNYNTVGAFYQYKF
jgi:hypothetical protein